MSDDEYDTPTDLPHVDPAPMPANEYQRNPLQPDNPVYGTVELTAQNPE